MHSGSESTGPLKEQARGFWARHSEVTTDGAGYLIGEWPAALAGHRLLGEWGVVQNLIVQNKIAAGRCLDAGCGPGLWLEKLAGLFGHADGFDGAAGMVEMARRRLGQAAIQNASVTQADVLSFDTSARYDFIFVGGVLTYLEDDDAVTAIEKLRDLLAPGGWLLFRDSTYRGFTRRRTEPLKPGLFADPAAERPPYFAIYRQVHELRALLEKSGISVQKVALNHHYKLADFTEEGLRAVNWMSGKRLARDPALAEAWARRLHRYRHVALLPAYHLLRLSPVPLWRMQNHWFLCRAGA